MSIFNPNRNLSSMWLCSINDQPNTQLGRGERSISAMLGEGGGKGVEGGKGVTRTIKTMVIRAVGRSKT